MRPSRFFPVILLLLAISVAASAALVNYSVPNTQTITIFFILVFISLSSLVSLTVYTWKKFTNPNTEPIVRKTIGTSSFVSLTVVSLGALKVSHLLGPLQVILIAAIVVAFFYLRKN